MVNCCFEPSQPLQFISELKTNFHPSHGYSAHMSLNVNHTFSTTQLKYMKRKGGEENEKKKYQEEREKGAGG